MSRVTPTWVLATARSRVQRAYRDARRSVHRQPVAVSSVPRPQRPSRHAQRLRLSHALTASDLNGTYLECWPVASRAWRELAGLEAVLVLVAPEADVPAAFRADPNVHVFEPVDGLHTALQAQCIRLLYPALLEADGVVTTDVDMVPLNRRYFHTPPSHVHADHFVAYRDVLLWGDEIPICYNAALPRTWGDVFAIRDLDDVRRTLTAWGTGLRYDGTRGGHGWDTDQVMLYRTLTKRAHSHRDTWILRDELTGHRRLDRKPIEWRGGLDDAERRALRRGLFSDYHLLLPHSEYSELNELVMRTALGA